MRIAVIGAGGIGSHLIHMLVNTVSKEDSITVIDGDKFEEKNLSRQLFGRDMLAENKAFAMYRMYGHLCDIEAEEKFILDYSELSGFDLVFCVPDNNLCRRIAFEAQAEYGFTLIVAGNETTSSNALIQMQWMNTYDYLLPYERHPEYLQDSAPQNSCSIHIEEMPQTIVANTIAAAQCMALYTCYMDGQYDMPTDYAHDHLPIEYSWGVTFMNKITAKDILTCQKKGGLT